MQESEEGPKREQKLNKPWTRAPFWTRGCWSWHGLPWGKERRVWAASELSCQRRLGRQKYPWAPQVSWSPCKSKPNYLYTMSAACASDVLDTHLKQKCWLFFGFFYFFFICLRALFVVYLLVAGFWGCFFFPATLRREDDFVIWTTSKLIITLI